MCLPHAEAAHLLEALDELGWCQETGMGIAPIGHAEIKAWASLMDRQIAPWEAKALRAASIAYCSIARDPEAPEPFAAPILVSPFKALAKRLNK